VKLTENGRCVVAGLQATSVDVVVVELGVDEEVEDDVVLDVDLIVPVVELVVVIVAGHG